VIRDGKRQDEICRFVLRDRLTPLECERLQGFPDGWTKGLSDTQRYKCLGNAVTVNMVEWIGKRIVEFVNNEFWFWVIIGIVDVALIAAKKYLGNYIWNRHTISEWIHKIFKQKWDYVILIATIAVPIIFPTLQPADWFTCAIRYTVIGHWFWHEDRGGWI